MAAVGIAVAVLASALGWLWFAPVLGWDSAATVYLVWIWRTIWRLDASDTARLAVREDPNRNLAHALLLVACLASLVAVVVFLVAATPATGGVREARITAGVVSVALSWAVVHTLYTARYAHMYYSRPEGGVDFHQNGRPRYSDFAYLAFTIGMTFQVSDTDLSSAEMRATVLFHSMISYLFGAAIIAATVNLLASLVR